MERYAPLALGPAIPAQYDFQHVNTWRQAHNPGASVPIEVVPPRMSLGELQDIELQKDGETAGTGCLLIIQKL